MVGDPVVKVWCDKCGAEEEFGMTSLANGGYDNRDLERGLIREGWRLADGLDGETICPDCAEEGAEDQ